MEFGCELVVWLYPAFKCLAAKCGTLVTWTNNAFSREKLKFKKNKLKCF